MTSSSLSLLIFSTEILFLVFKSLQREIDQFHLGLSCKKLRDIYMHLEFDPTNFQFLFTNPTHPYIFRNGHHFLNRVTIKFEKILYAKKCKYVLFNKICLLLYSLTFFSFKLFKNPFFIRI